MSVKSNLPYKTLIDLLVYFNNRAPRELQMTEKEYSEYKAFLHALKDVYIPCSKCQQMIAPDEIYEIENEEAVCEQCTGK